MTPSRSPQGNGLRDATRVLHCDFKLLFDARLDGSHFRLCVFGADGRVFVPRGRQSRGGAAGAYPETRTRLDRQIRHAIRAALLQPANHRPIARAATGQLSRYGRRPAASLAQRNRTTRAGQATACRHDRGPEIGRAHV